MNDTVDSIAIVVIDRPGRYGKQLVSHLGRRTGGSWSADTQSGWIDLAGCRSAVTAHQHRLELKVTGPASEIDRLQTVVESHLRRFATDQDLTIAWTRTDGLDITPQ